MTLNCNVKLENNHWSNVSEGAKDLLMRILTFSEKRISTKEVMGHSWLQKIEKLKEYQGRNQKRIKILN